MHDVRHSMGDQSRLVPTIFAIDYAQCGRPVAESCSSPQISPRGTLVATCVCHEASSHSRAARAGAERVGSTMTKASKTGSASASRGVACASRPRVVVGRDSQESTKAIRYDDALSSVAAPLRSKALVR